MTIPRSPGGDAPQHPLAQAIARYRGARRADDPSVEILVEPAMSIPANTVVPQFAWRAATRDAAEAPASAHAVMGRSAARSALEAVLTETLAAILDPSDAAAIGIEQARVILPKGGGPAAVSIVLRPIDASHAPDAVREIGAFLTDAPEPWPAWLRAFGAMARRVAPFGEERCLWLVRMVWREAEKHGARLVTTPVIARSADAAIALAAAFEAACDLRRLPGSSLDDALARLSDAHAVPCRSMAKSEAHVRQAVEPLLRGSAA